MNPRYFLYSTGISALGLALRSCLPEAEVTLWPSHVENGVEELLYNEFPGLKIAKPGSEALELAFKECDFLLHGSGPSIVAENDIVRWRQEKDLTGKILCGKPAEGNHGSTGKGLKRPAYTTVEKSYF